MCVSVGMREEPVCEGVLPPTSCNTMVILSLMLSPIVLWSLLKVAVFLCVGGDDLLNERGRDLESLSSPAS